MTGKQDPAAFEWLDEHSYRTLLAYRRIPPGDARAGSSEEADTGSIVVLSGTIEPGAAATLDPLIPIASEQADLPLGGEYAILFLDGDGQTLAAYPFEPSFVAFGPEGFMDSPVGIFAFSVPWRADVTEIRMTGPGGLLHQAMTSAHPPTVQVVYPNGWEILNGQQTVSWTGSDLDGDELVYSVLLSTDSGISWTPLAGDTQDTSLTWDTDIGPGGTASCLIRVVACDGVLGAEDRSDQVFSVTKAGPEVEILRPVLDAVLPAGSTVAFEGVALDDEDGLLSGADVEWTSSLDGLLGHGPLLPVILSDGDHTVTFSATDADGYTSSEQVAVHVQAIALPDAAITSAGLGFPDRLFLGQSNRITARIDNRGPACSLNLVMLANGAEVVSVPVTVDGYARREVAVAWIPSATGWITCDFSLRDIIPADAFSDNNGAYAVRLVEVPGPGEMYDTDGDQLPDWWERLHFDDPTVAVWHVDSDLDGSNNFQEYRAGTLPTAAWSRLRLQALRLAASGRLELQWQSVPGRVYVPWYAEGAALPPGPMEMAIPAANASTSIDLSPEEAGFFHIRLE